MTATRDSLSGPDESAGVVSGSDRGPQEPPGIVIPPPGPRSRALHARLARTECPAFEARRDARATTSDEDQAPIVYARGRGSNVWDVDGNRYVDMVAGFGALALGHGPPAVLAAAHAQLDELTLALGDVYATEVKVGLCERLAGFLPEPGARVVLGLSGADAVTAALKTAVLATGKPGVVAFEGSYHGLSYAPLAACGLNRAFREPFAVQLGRHVTFVPYPRPAGDLDACLARVRAAVRAGAGAVLVEPILGRGGCVNPHPELLRSLRRVCDEGGALLVADEIWTGLGRCGAWLASTKDPEHGTLPDLVCLGKALGGGFPISACIGRASVMRAWGAHGGATIHTATHFGWPVACSAAQATLGQIEKLGRRPDFGAILSRALATTSARAPDLSGDGMMWGVHTESAARALGVARRLLEAGWIVLTGGADGATLTLTPPLNIAEDLLTRFASSLAEALRDAPLSGE